LAYFVLLVAILATRKLGDTAVFASKITQYDQDLLDLPSNGLLWKIFDEARS